MACKLTKNDTITNAFLRIFLGQLSLEHLRAIASVRAASYLDVFCTYSTLPESIIHFRHYQHLHCFLDYYRESPSTSPTQFIWKIKTLIVLFYFRITVAFYKKSLWYTEVVVQRPNACNFIKKETLMLVFSCEFCEIFRNTFFHRTSPVAAFGCIVMPYVCFLSCCAEFLFRQHGQ